MEMESRGVRLPVSVRMDEDNQPSVIEGYAAVYYDGTRETEYELWPGTLERIMPGAFDDRLSDDCRGLFDHKSHLVLGRNGATMTLSVDSRGREIRNTRQAGRTRHADPRFFGHGRHDPPGRRIGQLVCVHGCNIDVEMGRTDSRRRIYGGHSRGNGIRPAAGRRPGHLSGLRGHRGSDAEMP